MLRTAARNGIVTTACRLVYDGRRHYAINDGAIACPVGALLLEQNDEWAVQRARYMTLESVGQLSDDPLISLPAVAR